MNRASAPSYDLFKLIVTIILVIILILMLLRGCATAPAAPLPVENGAVSAPTQSSGPPVETKAVPPSATAVAVTLSTVPSVTPTTSATATSDATTPTAIVATTAPDSTATEPATTAVVPTTTTGDSTACNTSVPSRLSVGETARVVQRLNMRSEASITTPIMQTNPTGTQVEIIGGPVCTAVGDRAYLWWQIRLADGTEGWSAESPLNDATYLLEPIP